MADAPPPESEVAEVAEPELAEAPAAEAAAAEAPAAAAAAEAPDAAAAAEAPKAAGGLTPAMLDRAVKQIEFYFSDSVSSASSKRVRYSQCSRARPEPATRQVPAAADARERGGLRGHLRHRDFRAHARNPEGAAAAVQP